MTRNSTEIRSLATALLLLCTLRSFAQNDFNGNVAKQIEQSEQAQARLSEDDKRLGYFYRIVCLAEAADTSTKSKQQLERYVDQDGLVKVLFILRDITATAQLIDEIKSHNGIVIQAGKYVAYILGRVPPKSLRQNIKSKDILRLDWPTEPIHGPYQPN